MNLLKRVKQSQSLLSRATFAIGIILLISFISIFAGFEVYKNFYLLPSALTHVEDLNISADQSIFDILKNTISLKTLVSDEYSEEEYLNSNNKPTYFTSLIDNIGMNEEIYYDIAFVIDDSFFSYKGQPLFISSLDIEELSRSNNELLILNSYTYYNLDKALVVGIKDANFSILFYIKNTLISSLNSLSIFESFTILADEDKNILSSEKIDNFRIDLNNVDGNSYELNGKKYYLQIKEATLTGGFNKKIYFYDFIYENALYGDISLVEFIVLLIIGILLIFITIVLILSFNKITKPINKLSKDIKEIDLNKLDEYELAEKKIANEIDVLENSYILMLNRLKSLLIKQQEDSEVQRKLELDALQMQINPHFLYNALDTIAWMAKINKEKNIETFVIALARFYRLSLHKGAKFILVKEEVDIIRYFLEIELKRHPNLFTYRINFDESLSDYKVLKLILQPFVENIIKYAFVNEEKQGKIIINIVSKDNNIEFSIIDNGIGFDTSKLFNSDNKLSGFGIHNVIERLRLEYKDKFIYEITSEIGKGTKVVLSIPKSQ